MVNNISCVILAGGANKRFNGTTKVNLVIGRETIIYRIIRTIRNIFDEIIIVSNTPEEFKDYNNYKIVGDLYPGLGPLGGIHSALKASSKEALFVFAGDMPLLDQNYILRQIDFFSSNKCDCLIPRVDKLIEPLHAIYSVSIIKTLEEYLTSDNNKAVRDFIKLLNVSYLEFEASDDTKNAFTNINSPSDIIIVEEIVGSM